MSPRGKTIILVLFVAICAAAPVIAHRIRARGEEATPADLYKVVYNQVSAFRADDFPLAYSQASNGMQHKFNPSQFEEMIRRDYSDITSADRVEFGLVKCREQHAIMQVFFIGHDGSVLPCIYSLIYENSGWKVDGARMLPRRSSESQGSEIRA